jgi:hypothetical protein
MVFRNEPNEDGRRKRLSAPNIDGPTAQKAAIVDLSESLSQLYDQALKLGHSEAALFIGCASLSVSETVEMVQKSTPACAQPAQTRPSGADE